MIRITKFSENTLSYPELDKYKLTHRHLQVQEIATLIKNHNTSSDPEWKNILVKKDSFAS